MSNKIKSNTERAIALQNKGMFREAVDIYEKILRSDNSNYLVKINISLCYLNTHSFEKAAAILHELHHEKPDDFQTLKFCGVAYAKMGVFDLAIKFLKRALSNQPEDFETWIEITTAASANQQDIDAVYYATQAISLKPTSPIAHNNLGGTFMTIGKMDEALYCFETALQLDPNNLMALGNTATVYEKKGDATRAIATLEKCLLQVRQGSIQESEIKFKLSFSHLYCGNLKLGWELFDEGFKPKNTRTRTPKRHFDAPQWCGQPIQDKRLLIWGEQGLGDELMFFKALPDVFEHCNHIIIECMPRLVSMFQRSFPNCHVRERSVDNSILLKPLYSDFDYHIPVGSLMRLFRNEISQFKKAMPYIVVDPTLEIKFRERLAAFKPKKLVGICWRSGKLAGDRNLNYTPISAWAPIFSVPNVQFINLQYGDCQAELDQVRHHFGVEVINWADVNLKDDQESLAAIIKNLDMVVSAGTAVAQLTGAIGTHLKLFMPRAWTLLGQNEYPWAANVELFISDPDQSVEHLFPEIARSLST